MCFLKRSKGALEREQPLRPSIGILLLARHGLDEASLQHGSKTRIARNLKSNDPLKEEKKRL